MTSLANRFLQFENSRRVLRPKTVLIAQSEETGWRSLYAAIFEEAPFHATEPALRHPSLIYHLCRPTQVCARLKRRARESAHRTSAHMRDAGRSNNGMAAFGSSGDPQVYLRHRSMRPLLMKCTVAISRC